MLKMSTNWGFLLGYFLGCFEQCYSDGGNAGMGGGTR